MIGSDYDADDESYDYGDDDADESTDDDADDDFDDNFDDDYHDSLSADDTDLGALRRNDPAPTRVRIRQMTDGDAYYRGAPLPEAIRAERRATLRALTEALRGNTHATAVAIDIGYVDAVENLNLDIVLDMIQNRRALSSLDLRNLIDDGARFDVCDRYIRAASRNPSIRALRLSACRFSAESLLLLLAGSGTAMKLRKLDLSYCTIRAPLDAPPSHASSLESSVANAAKHNSTLTDLVFAPNYPHGVDNRYAICVVNGLALAVQSKLETLEMCTNSPPLDLCRAIQGLLRSTTSSRLRTLRLRNCTFKGGTFIPLADGLSHCANLYTLSLISCSFDEESTVLLEAAFQAGSHSGKLVRLCIHGGCRFWCVRESNALFNPLGPMSQLNRLELSMDGRKVADYDIILQSVGRSPMLEFLHLAVVFPIDKDEKFGCPFSAMAANLPGLSALQFFLFTIKSDQMSKLDGGYTSWPLFVEAIRKNSSLISVVGRWVYPYRAAENVFDTVELAKLARYAKRNSVLPFLLPPSRNLPVKLWPSLAKTVQRCEHGAGWIVRMVLALGQHRQKPPLPLSSKVCRKRVFPE